MKTFRVLRPYGNYSKGQIIQPTGVYRSILLSIKVIEEVKDIESAEINNRMIVSRSELTRRDLRVSKASRTAADRGSHE